MPVQGAHAPSSSSRAHDWTYCTLAHEQKSQPFSEELYNIPACVEKAKGLKLQV